MAKSEDDKVEVDCDVCNDTYRVTMLLTYGSMTVTCAWCPPHKDLTPQD